MKLSTEAKIGLIVLATIAFVIWGINYLKGKNILKRTDVYYVVYDNIQGLEKSAGVFASGYKVGLINSIDFDKKSSRKIVVGFVVNDNFKIPVNSSITLTVSLLGTKSLEIVTSDADKYYQYGDTLKGIVEGDPIGKLQTQILPLAENLKITLSRLDTVISSLNSTFDPESQQKLKQTISNIESGTAMMKPGGKLDVTIKNLQSFSSTLDKNKGKLDSVFTHLDNITDSIAGANVKRTIDNIQATFDQSNTLLAKINSGEGTLGLLATNDSLYNQLVIATKNLSLLLEDLNKNPKRYVHFSIFGKKDKTQK